MTFTVSVQGLAEAQKALPAKVDSIAGAVRTAMTSLTLALLVKVKEEKLSGQVVNVRTGRLRRSITNAVIDEGGSIVGTVGTNVEYARRIEEGFTGDERVREHMRTAKQAFGRQIKNPHATMVRAHTRHVNTPPRSFLASALQEMEPQVRADLMHAMEVGSGAQH